MIIPDEIKIRLGIKLDESAIATPKRTNRKPPCISFFMPF
jgi:hypothetical protein